MFTDEMRRDPFPTYDMMRATSPLLHVPNLDVFMVFDYEGVKQALSDHASFRSAVSERGSVVAEWLIFLDNPRHEKLRKLILRAFTPKVVAGLEPRIRELSRTLLGRSLPRGEMDLAEDYATPLPMMVIAEMLGIPAEDWSRFRRWTDGALDLGSTIAGGPEADRAIAAFTEINEEMRGYFAGLIAARRSVPREDLLTRLIEAEVDGERLSELELLGFFQILLVAGSETTTNLINNAMLCFRDHPGELARLRDNAALLPRAIEEILRYKSPAQALFRMTTRDVELHGQTIPAGKLVLPIVGAANRDPLVFNDPNRFDVSREPNPHLAFGQGVHFCLGAALSRLEARVALTDLLELANFSIDDAPWVPRKPFNVHGPARLPVRFSPTLPDRRSEQDQP